MDHLAKQILKDVALEEIAPKAVHPGPGNPVDHWSPAILLERGAYLKKMAKFGDGSASETLREYPQHFAMLSFEAEMAKPKSIKTTPICSACSRVLRHW